MATWEEIQQGIFAGESGGDYDALFNFQNRKDGIFNDIEVSEMTINELLDFSEPDGAYGTYVGLNNKGTVSTPMGAYQIVGSTLKEAKKALDLTGEEVFSPTMQDRIAKWILKTQGTKAWKGYEGEEVRAGDTSMVQPNKMNALQLQQMSQRPQGLMGMLQQTGNKLRNLDLGDANTRAVIGSFSRSPVGEKLRQLNIGMAARDEKLKKINTTLAYLDREEGGKPYADAIRAGADAQSTLKDFLTVTGKTGNTNIQSSVPLPNLAGSLITLKTGEVYVQTRDNRRLTDKKEIDEYIEKAQKAEAEYERSITGARETGKLETKLEFGQRIKEAETFGAKKVEWVSEARKQSGNIQSTINLYKQALGLLQQDPPAETGRVRKLIPTTSAQTALLETVKGELGLDVIGSVTFGALSESELNLAMDLGLPSDKLSNAELQEWLKERIEVKTKAAAALEGTASYLAQPNTTLQSYYNDYLAIPVPNTAADVKVDPKNPLGI